ncbi:MAG: hypothetical protein GKR87_10755 [Kiritimatiellae bacterium]|nr:hypothetical protein [Kiritimatiellia bacterium]
MNQQNITGRKDLDTAIWSYTWNVNSQIWNAAQQVYPDPLAGLVDGSNYWGILVASMPEGLNRFQFVARDEVGNESSGVIVDITVDTTAPTPPVIDPLASPYTSPGNDRTIEITGTRDADTDIWINGVRVLTHDPNTSWNLFRVLMEGNNQLGFVSTDLAGNSSPTVTVSYVLDTQAEMISSLVAVETNRRVELTWPPITDFAGDFAAYTLYRSDTPITNLSGRAPYSVFTSLVDTVYIDVDVAPTTTYHYAVTSVDVLGNISDLTTTQITLSDWQETIIGWIVGNQIVPTGAVYQLYFSTQSFESTNALPPGVKVYQGSVIAQIQPWYWVIHYTPSIQAPAVDTLWGHSVRERRVDITPLEELHLSKTPEGTVLNMALQHDVGGDRLDASFHSTHLATYSLDRSTNGVNWNLLHDNGSGSLDTYYTDSIQIDPSVRYRVTITIGP